MAFVDKYPIVFERTGRSLGSIRRLLCVITCVDMELLDQCPESEKKKYTSLGAAMLITTVLSFFSAYIAVDYFFPQIDASGFSVSVQHLLAIVPSLIWMLIIFNLQRFVVAGNSRTSDADGAGVEELVTALPSIIMSIVIGMIVAIPLEVTIFKPEIDMALRMEQERDFLDNATKREEASRSIRLQSCTEFYRYQLKNELPLIRCLPRSNGEQVLLQPMADSGTTAAESPVDVKPDSATELSAGASEPVLPTGMPVATTATAVTDRQSVVEENQSVETVQRDPEPASILDALKAVAERASQDSDAARREEDVHRLGGGLVFRAEALFKHVPFFAYAVMLLIIFVQLTPVLIKMMAVKSPYDYLQEMQNRLVVAAGTIRVKEGDIYRYPFDPHYGGIEVNAVAVFDEFGQGKPVTLFHRADEVVEKMREKFSKENRELETQRLSEMERRYRRLNKLTRTP